MLYVIKRRSFLEVMAFYSQNIGTLNHMKVFLYDSLVRFNNGNLTTLTTVNGVPFALTASDFSAEPFTEERFQDLLDGQILIEKSPLILLLEKVQKCATQIFKNKTRQWKRLNAFLCSFPKCTVK